MHWFTTLLNPVRRAFHGSDPVARATLRPIPVTEWVCLCSRLWSDEVITAICGICEGNFKRSSAKGRQ